MKILYITRPFFLLFCAVACGTKSHKETASDNIVKDTTIITNAAVIDTFETGKVITHVVCKADAGQSYALYIPAKGNHEPLPVIYFFDPHGDGALPVVKYRSLADQYDFILIGSNNSKNGSDWSTAEIIWEDLFNDSRKRLKINPDRIYACGFSGGAKVAGYVALNHNEVKGVIANGAGLPDETPPGNFNFTFTAIAGEGDMNMTDLVAIYNGLDKTQTRHRIIFFDGRHEWAPENTMNIAFAGLQLDAMYKKQIPIDGVFINNYIAESKKRIDDYLKTNNYVHAEEACILSISLLDGLTDNVSWFKEKDASLKSNSVYQKQFQVQQNLLVTEQKTKAIYQQQFQQGDMNYWTNTIRELQKRSKVKTAEGAMYQRLVAYLSLAFYSISNQLISSHQDKEAQYFVELYKMDDPANSEAWYFSAILNARSNNTRAAQDDLLKAVANGFTDKNRLLQQPEFNNPGIDLAEIESKMKNEE